MTESVESMRTLDQRQAAERVDQLIAEAVAALAAALSVRPRLTPLAANTTHCDDPTDHGPKGRLQVARSYWLDDLPVGGDRAAYFDALYAYWTSHGYRVLEDGRGRTVRDRGTGEVRSAPMLWVERTEDAFRLNLYGSAGGELSLGANSPCVWPEGVPTDAAAGRPTS